MKTSTSESNVTETLEPSEQDALVFQNIADEFEKNLEEFQAKAKLLSKNALRRVAVTLQGHPLNYRGIKFTSKDEADLFDLGVKIDKAKIKMWYILEKAKQQEEGEDNE